MKPIEIEIEIELDSDLPTKKLHSKFIKLMGTPVEHQEKEFLDLDFNEPNSEVVSKLIKPYKDFYIALSKYGLSEEKALAHTLNTYLNIYNLTQEVRKNPLLTTLAVFNFYIFKGLK